MGVVYLAQDQRLGRAVALKAISTSVVADPARRERLRREARAAGQLAHPGIATVYALEEFGDDLFIAGEFIAGETLREEVSRGPADAARVLETALELTHALSAAHDRGVVHRDLKPENVIRATDGKLKILDFGLARMRDLPPDLAHLTDDGTVFGTPGYMSPEQIRRGHVDGRSDLFALGILLHEMLTGVHPFAGADSAATIARILESEPALLSGPSGGSHDTGSVRHGLVGIIRVLLRKDPAARFGSAHELLAALARLRTGEHASLPVMTAPWAQQAKRWWRFHQVATSVFYAAVLATTWGARQELGNAIGLPVFLFAMVAMASATTIRMHLWFAAASMPEEWAHQHARNWKWLRTADLAFVAAAVAAGLLVLNRNPILGVVLVTLGVLALLSATIIEPATTRAAFGRQ